MRQNIGGVRRCGGLSYPGGMCVRELDGAGEGAIEMGWGG